MKENNYGKPKRISNDKRYKSKGKKSKSPVKGHKSGKTIPNQTTDSNFDRGTIEKLVSTARNQNKDNFAINNTISDKPLVEESKIEVIEMGDKGSAKVVANNDNLQTFESNNQGNLLKNIHKLYIGTYNQIT